MPTLKSLTTMSDAEFYATLNAGAYTVGRRDVTRRHGWSRPRFSRRRFATAQAAREYAWTLRHRAERRASRRTVRWDVFIESQDWSGATVYSKLPATNVHYFAWMEN